MQSRQCAANQQAFRHALMCPGVRTEAQENDVHIAKSTTGVYGKLPALPVPKHICVPIPSHPILVPCHDLQSASTGVVVSGYEQVDARNWYSLLLALQVSLLLLAF